MEEKTARMDLDHQYTKEYGYILIPSCIGCKENLEYKYSDMRRVHIFECPSVIEGFNLQIEYRLNKKDQKRSKQTKRWN